MRKRENKIQNITATRISYKSSISLSVQLKSYFILPIWLLLKLFMLVFGQVTPCYAFWAVQIVPFWSHVHNSFQQVLQLVVNRSLQSNNISEQNLFANCERNNKSKGRISSNCPWKLFFDYLIKLVFVNSILVHGSLQ